MVPCFVYENTVLWIVPPPLPYQTSSFLILDHIMCRLLLISCVNVHLHHRKITDGDHGQMETFVDILTIVPWEISL